MCLAPFILSLPPPHSQPTSGLDGATAFDVIKTMHDSAKQSRGAFSVLLSIHQPSTRLLSLFDHILLLGNNGSIFFGTVPEAIQHFNSIGFQIPQDTNPVDYSLLVSDDSFNRMNGSNEIKFAQKYASSELGKKVNEMVSKSIVTASQPDTDGKYEKDDVSFLRQYSTLVKRGFMLVMRDPTLYYLQIVMHIVYGLLIGLTFMNVDAIIGPEINYVAGSILWCLMLNMYVHVFKIFFLVTHNQRFRHERANGSYRVLPHFFAELTVTAISHVLFIPGVLIAFALIGLPTKSQGFFILVSYFVGLASESMLYFITKFTNNAAVAVVAAQAVLVLITVFGGGVYLPLDDIGFWNWFAQIAISTQGSKANTLNVYEHIDFVCGPQAQIIRDGGGAGTCLFDALEFPCDAFDDGDQICLVKGLTVADVKNGISGDHWEYFGYLVLLFVGFRLLVLALSYYPREHISALIKARVYVNITRKICNPASELQKASTGLSPENNGDTDPTRIQKGNEQQMVHADNTLDDLEDSESRLHLSENVLTEELSESPMHKKQSSFVQRDQFYLRFSDVVVTLPKTGKVLIDHVTAYATSGRVLALMGPSGAGKTTLLNALSGRATYAEVNGDIQLRNRPLTAEDLDYVPQFNSLNEFFTVRELLAYMAELCTLGDDVDKDLRVSGLLAVLGLSHRADTVIRHLSGGEKKRVSVGMGIITQPPVLYLDEPTTGLDSSAAYMVVKYIAHVAKFTDTIVILTIHQPSKIVFELLEDMILLENGRLGYFGTRVDAQDYFKSLGVNCPHRANPADIYADLVHGNPPLEDKSSKKTWKDLYAQSNFVVPLPASEKDGIDNRESHGIQRPGLFKATMTLTTHLVITYWRDITVYWLRLLELIVVAVYVGTIFPTLSKSVESIGDISAALFFNQWCVLFAVVAAASAFVYERRIALQVMLNSGYSPAQYCFAQFCAPVPYQVVISFIFQAFFHYICFVHIDPSFGAYAYASLTTMGLLFIMEGIMLCVVEVVKNDMLATTFAMIVLGILFLFPGFFVATEDIVPGVRWLSYMMPSRYSLNGSLFSLFSGQSFENEYSPSGFTSGDDILGDFFDISSDYPMWGSWAGLLGYTLLFRLCHYACVKFTVFPYLKSGKISSSSPQE